VIGSLNQGAFGCVWVTSCIVTTGVNACVGTGGISCACENACTVITGGNACVISSTTVYVETLTVGCDDDVLILVDNFFTLKFSLFFSAHIHSYYSTWAGHPCEAFVLPLIILLLFTLLLSPRLLDLEYDCTPLVDGSGMSDEIAYISI
jgi:hypothetical protein